MTPGLRQAVRKRLVSVLFLMVILAGLLFGSAVTGAGDTLNVFVAPIAGDLVEIDYVQSGTWCGTNSPPEAQVSVVSTGGICDQGVLDGSGSSDPEGYPLDWGWQFLTQPVGSVLTEDDLEFTSPWLAFFYPDVHGTWEVGLTDVATFDVSWECIWTEQVSCGANCCTSLHRIETSADVRSLLEPRSGLARPVLQPPACPCEPPA